MTQIPHQFKIIPPEIQLPPRAGNKAALCLVIFGALLMLLSMAGCMGTSRAFKDVAPQFATLAGGELTDYINNDKNITPEIKAERLGLVAELSAATADPAKVELARVKTVWAKLDPLYRAYITADTTASEPARALYLQTADKINALIEAESERQANILAPFNPASAQ